MKVRSLFLSAVLIVVFLCISPVNASETLESRISAFQQSGGEMGFNESVHKPDQKGSIIQIKDKQYSCGIGTQARSDIIADLNGEFEKFEAQIGVQWQGGNSKASVIFQVFVDGEKRFDSGLIRENDQAQAVSISVAGGEQMHLILTDGGDGITDDAANWADAKLIRAKTGKPKITEKPFDISGFARVVTFDPNVTASNPGRTEEMTAKEIFLETEITADASGNYTVPVSGNGWGCIGLQWYETRLLKELAVEFAEGTQAPDAKKVVVEWWVGESVWQGYWQALQGEVIKEDNRLIFPINWRNFRLSQTGRATSALGVQKIRWLFPPTDKPIVVRKLEAYTHSRWDTLDLHLETEKPQQGQSAKIGIYNGDFVNAEGKNTRQLTWDLSGPLDIKVRYCRTGKTLLKTNRTLINLELPDGAFSISVDDVLTNGCVYVRDFGLFVTTQPAKYSLEEYRRKIAGQETVLERVLKMPDQSFKQAMEKTHLKIQNNGPTILSLACENHKFLLQRDGVISFAENAWLRGGIQEHHLEKFKFIPKFGQGLNESWSRSLYGGWLPIVENSAEQDGVVYSQRTYVAPYGKADIQAHPWLTRKPICVVEINIENVLTYSAEASAGLKFMSDVNQPGQLEKVDGGVVIKNGDGLFAFADTSGVTSLEIVCEQGQVSLKGRIPAQTRQRCVVYIPSWQMKADEYTSLKTGRDFLCDTQSYWNGIVGSVMQIEIPEPLLSDIIRASEVHCLMAARNEEAGKRFAPWIAAWCYGPLESEAHSIIRGLDFFGYEDFARRGLDYFISRYNKAGYLTTGYTWLGLGWHLWTLGEHYERTKNSQWLRENAPELMRVSRWIIAQRDKTKRLDARGEKVPEYSLMPPGVAADWNRFGYRSYLEGNFYAGLRGTAEVLSDINYPGAEKLLENAEDFGEAIRRSYNWTTSKTPAVELLNGTWVPYCPHFVHCFGPCDDIYANEDWGRSWCYDTEFSQHHFAALGLLDKNDRKIDWIVNYMEDIPFLQTCIGGVYPGEERKKDWFNLGGFGRLQPYYARIAEVYALRDDVKPFIRVYFNALATLINTESLWLWECPGGQAAWDKTHETGWFLCQSRIMMVNERGDELWLAPFVTNHWTKNGMVAAVRNAPTKFGNVSYEIRSFADKGYIEAEIDPPCRGIPKAVVIRLRHPEGKRMKAVTVNGKEHNDFNAEKEYVRIEPTGCKIQVRAEY